MAYSTKGGVGKSTSLLTIAQYFSKKGYRICIIDADPQANLSKTILKDEVFKDEYLSMTDLFSAKVDCEKVHKAIYNVTDNLDIIGSSLALPLSVFIKSLVACTAIQCQIRLRYGQQHFFRRFFANHNQARSIRPLQ